MSGVTIVRGFVVLAVLTSFFAGPCVAVCQGWSASSHERMACCVDKSEDAAKACCASAEGRNNSETASALAVFPPALQLMPLALSPTADPIEHNDIDRDTPHPLTANANRHALLSIFLI
jgi:hypothetical protein